MHVTHVTSNYSACTRQEGMNAKEIMETISCLVLFRPNPLQAHHTWLFEERGSGGSLLSELRLSPCASAVSCTAYFCDANIGFESRTVVGLCAPVSLQEQK